ncbi:MAG: ribosome silencing factor, partial [Flavobacteriaceae bacterium]|nr:ribosome silencing factor [Flavobacteriaceae bacterium]
QVNAIVNSVQKTVSKAIQEKPWHVEGSNNAEWVLLDYVHVVVHVFQKQIREFYNIEGLWGDAKSVIIETTTKKEEA